MNEETLTELVQRVRDDLEYRRGVSPRIEEVHVDERGDIHAVATDRAEKSLCLGPGGRIAAEIAKRIGKRITFYSREEILMKQHRLALACERVQEIPASNMKGVDDFLSILSEAIEFHSKHPFEELILNNRKQIQVPSAVAFSGGIDSTAALAIAKNLNMNPTALTVNFGEHFLTSLDIKRIRRTCEAMGVTIVFLDRFEEVREIVKSTEAGNLHPCGQCHQTMYQVLEEYCEESEVKILYTGELLPSGRQSIVMRKDLIVIHLPALFALTKYETHMICQQEGIPLQKREFGCPLVERGHAKGWRIVGPSIYRVLRELEAGLVTTGQSLKLIKRIFRGARLSTQEGVVRD